MITAKTIVQNLNTILESTGIEDFPFGDFNGDTLQLLRHSMAGDCGWDTPQSQDDLFAVLICCSQAAARLRHQNE
jgi:hypothetical protein